MTSLLPANAANEEVVLSVVDDCTFDTVSLQQLQQQAVERGWSRLHAWSLMQLLPHREALHEQRMFPKNALLGMAFLVDRLSADAVIDEWISDPNPDLARLVALRTARDPTLLSAIDVRSQAWRALWAAHIAAGGVKWPPVSDQELLGRSLLDTAVAQEDPNGLIQVLAKDLVQVALKYENRKELWRLPASSGGPVLLPLVAEAALRQLEAGQPLAAPEPELAEAVLTQARGLYLSPSTLNVILSWDVRVHEDDALKWLQRAKNENWAGQAANLGGAIQRRQWRQVAKEVYRTWQGGRSELRPAVEACQDLLPWWDRTLLSWYGQPRGDLDGRLLAQRVAELGASLAAERLDDVWERAGGERKYLPIHGTPDTRWREATNLAQNGSLRGGLLVLVQELQRDLPYNADLRELESIINRSRR